MINDYWLWLQISFSPFLILALPDFNSSKCILNIFLPNLENVPQVNHAKPAPVAQQADTTEDLPPIVAFDELINTTFNSFKELSAKLGVDVKTIVTYLFNELEFFLIQILS